MPDAYEIHEARQLGEENVISAADALANYGTIVPAGRVRTYLNATHTPSATETRTLSFSIIGRSAFRHAVTIPQSIALTSAQFFPMLTMGMEVKLFPGEQLQITRDVATAGSTMTLRTRFIDTDLPYYSYVEPLKKVVSSKLRHSSITPGGGSAGGGGGVSGGGSVGGGRVGGGRGSSSEPI